VAEETARGPSRDTERQAEPLPVWRPDTPGVLDLLRQAEIRDYQLHPWGSNYTFTVVLDDGAQGQSLAMYKPRKGEAPLYDFPGGTLYLRECAAYVVSQALGWHFVPPTVIRDGPHGIGSMQLFIPTAQEANYFTFRGERQVELRRIAAFDCLANNADRKGGHCLLGLDGRLWGIDHGLTFHAVYKLRTVIWEFQGLPIPDPLLKDMEGLLTRLEKREPPTPELSELISSAELDALCQRLARLLTDQRYPEPGPWRSVPWPRI